VPHNAFARAVLDRDGEALARLADAEPAETLFRLDSAMRGLAFGVPPWVFMSMLDGRPALRDWVEWAAEQDRLIRARPGDAGRDADLLVLRSAYGVGDLSLVVGAGVSMSAGLPSWNALVVEMIDRALGHATDGETRGELARAREELSTSAPQRAGALRDATESVHRALGNTFGEELRDALYDRGVAPSTLHAAIGRMLRPLVAPRMPRVHTILTYNFDDLLERAALDRGHEPTVHVSVAGAAGELRVGPPGAVDVYHVHGFRPSPGGAYADAHVEDVDLVFSESGYRAAYGEDETWTKRAQAGVFGNSPSVFLGCSLGDDESVTQLSVAHRRHPGWFNYAVLARSDDSGRDYRELGLHVLWARDHDEIPDVVDSMTASVDQPLVPRLPLAAVSA
jgi:hypothetical protein